MRGSRTVSNILDQAYLYMTEARKPFDEEDFQTMRKFNDILTALLCKEELIAAGKMREVERYGLPE